MPTIRKSPPATPPSINRREKPGGRQVAQQEPTLHHVSYFRHDGKGVALCGTITKPKPDSRAGNTPLTCPLCAVLKDIFKDM